MKAKATLSVNAKVRAEEARWQAESDLRTLVEAREVQKDAKRMAAVRKLAKEKAAVLKSLTPP